LKADPNAKPDPNLTTPALDQAYNAAKGGGTPAGTGGAGGKPTGTGGTAGAGATGPKPGGDFNHTPVPEQAVNTPVPVYVEVPDEVGASKVTLRYKPFGATKWKNQEMQKMGEGFGAEIPCEDVTTTGDIKYYIIAKDADENPAGSAGSLKEPYKVAIKNDIEGDAPSLPGKKPPDKCAAKEDCPPGLPGCPGPGAAKHGDKGWGASCEASTECKEGLVCLNGSCEEGKEGPAKPTGGKDNILGIAGQFDILLINSADKVCTGTDPSYTCFYPDGGGQFYGVPADKTGTNGIQGGFGFADVRLLASYDRLLVQAGPGKVGIGLHAGWAFGGSPSSDTAPPSSAKKNGSKNSQANAFLPLHLEGRVSYHIPVGDTIRPYVFIGGGVAQVNAAVNVTVCDRLDKKGHLIDSPDTSEEPSTKCPTKSPSALREGLEAYQITGLNFVGVGGGAAFFFDPKIPVGVAAELKVMFMLPTFGVVIAPTVGPVFAF